MQATSDQQGRLSEHVGVKRRSPGSRRGQGERTAVHTDVRGASLLALSQLAAEAGGCGLLGQAAGRGSMQAEKGCMSTGNLNTPSRAAPIKVETLPLMETLS